MKILIAQVVLGILIVAVSLSAKADPVDTFLCHRYAVAISDGAYDEEHGVNFNDGAFNETKAFTSALDASRLSLSSLQERDMAFFDVGRMYQAGYIAAKEGDPHNTMTSSEMDELGEHGAAVAGCN